MAIIYAIRQIEKPAKVERKPLRIRVRPVLVGPLRSLFGGVTAFEVGNCAATRLLLRATELLTPGHGQSRATTMALCCRSDTTSPRPSPASPLAITATDAEPTRVLTVGVAAFAVAYLGFTRDTTSWAMLLPFFVLAGGSIGCVETADHAAVATHAPDDLRVRRSGCSPASRASATSPPVPSPAS